MTLLSFSLPPVSLSSLTEASVSYPQHLIRRLSSLAQQHSLPLTNKDLSNPYSLAALFLTLAVLVVTMSWRDPFAFWRRNPSYEAQPGGSPHVRDSDFSYLTGADDETSRRLHQHHHRDHHNQPQYIERRPRNNNTTENATEDAPDILLLKHRGVTYPLHFPAYAIDDGVLTIGDIRRRAAEKTAASDYQRIKILYKGKLLRDDDVPCKDEGLKQQSEIMCIVSDVRPGESTSDLSGSENDKSEAGLSRSDSGTQQRPSKNKRKNDKKKDKKKKKRDEAAATAAAAAEANLAEGNGGGLAPPSFDQRPTSSSGRSTTSSIAPSPAPSLQNIRSGNAQVDALLYYLRGELAPMCEAYISQPPTELKAREYEHKRLSETILAQVILKADGIDSEDARTARRALIKEAQSWLNRIDEVDRSDS